MADRKITDLTALTTPASADVLPIVDVSEAAAADKNKKVTVGELFKGIPDGTAAAPAIAFESDDGNGFFLSTTDTIGIATNGVSRATVSTTAVTSTLPVIVPDGSAAAPSVAFTGSGTDTGLYSPGADQVAISTNGTGRVFVDSSGNVGLGSSSPSSFGGSSSLVVQKNGSGESAAVNILGSSTGSSLIRFADGTATASERNAGSIVVSHNDGSMQFGLQDSERLRITSDGKVGVGTSSPEQLIDVQGTTNPSIQVKSTGTASTDNARLRIAIGGTTANSEIYFADSAASAIGAIQYRHSDNRLSFTTNNDVRAVIDSSGRLGVGTTSPSQLLHLSSSGPRILLTQTSANSNAFLDAATSGVLEFSADDNNVAASSSIRFKVDGGEKARIDDSGRLLVGTSSAFTPVNPTSLQVAGGGIGIGTYVGATAGTYTFEFLKSRSSAVGGVTLVANNDNLGQIGFNGTDGVQAIHGATIAAFVDGTPGASDMPGRLVFSTTADGASSPTERMRINSAGGINVGSGVVSSASSNGNIVVGEGIYIGTFNGNNQIRSSSAGGGSATLYIGNAAIQVSSDRRLKENIVDTAVDAAEELKKVRVVDFTWNDPSDVSYNNRNARGIWTGVIAQELVDVFPFAVNAPRTEEDLTIDHDSETRWTVDQDQLVPVLIKGFQQALARIETLEAEVAALKGA